MQLDIHNWKTLKQYFPKSPFLKQELHKILFKHFSEYDLKEVDEIKSLNVVFVSEEKIRELNKDFREKNTVTDVLSFVLEKNPLIGEIYVCPEYIAKEFDHTEVLRAIVHGFLHLLGYEHNNHFTEGLNAKEEMFVKQENMLQNILYEINNRPGESG